MLINNCDIEFINQNAPLFMTPISITLIATIDNDRRYKLLFFKGDNGYTSLPLYTTHHYIIADSFERGLIPNEFRQYLVEQKFVEQITISAPDNNFFDEHKVYFMFKLTTKSLIQAIN